MLHSVVILGLFMGKYNVNTLACLPFLVKKEIMGLGFGVVTMIINILALPGPYVFGYLLDESKEDGVYSYSYTISIYFLTVVGFASLMFTILMNQIDMKQGRRQSDNFNEAATTVETT